MCSRFKPPASAPSQGDFTQWITADFNNDSYDKWLLICFLMSKNMHWQKKCHQNHFVKGVPMKIEKKCSTLKKKKKGSLNLTHAKGLFTWTCSFTQCKRTQSCLQRLIFKTGWTPRYDWLNWFTLPQDSFSLLKIPKSHWR